MKFITLKKTHQNYECSIGNGLYNLGEVECYEL
jgi:hypothetical protein